MNRGLEIPKVKDILIRKVIAFKPDFTNIDVIQAFNEHRISSAPVINESNEVIGYLSESDSIKCMGNCLFFDEQRNPTIESIMSKNVLLANSDWDIFELDHFFIQNHIRSAPVVDSSNHLQGIVSRRDALKALEKIMKERSDYKKGIQEPIELNMYDKIKMLVENH